MAYSIFIFDIIFAFILSATVLWRYSNWMRQPVLVTLAVLVAWYFSSLIVFIIPLDVSNSLFTKTNCSSVEPDTISTSTEISTTTTSITSTTTSSSSNTSSSVVNNSTTLNETSKISTPLALISNCSEPSSYIPTSNIYNLWRIVYWSSQFLTWLVLPLMQSFTQAGEFTFLGKLKSSLWDNMVYYSSYLFIAIILIIYISLQKDLHLDWDKLKAIAAATSNTWGLFMLVFMMGYGLVEVPRVLWHSSKRGYSLNQAYFKISKLWGEKNDAEGSLEEVLISVHSVARKMETMQDSSHLQSLVDVILNKVPLEMMDRVKRMTRNDVTDANSEITEASLAKLHKQVMVALTAHTRTIAQWDHMVDTVYWLEDNHKNSSSNERMFRRQSSTQSSILPPSLEWYTRCVIVPYSLKISSVVAGLMSVMLTWSEITFSCNSPTLSLFAIFIQSAADNEDYRWIEIISFLTICYMSICTFYTVFKVRVLNYYYLASNHQSDSYTLLFSGALLSRITPALSLNFLSLIHLDSHVASRYGVTTSYTKVMGHMDVVSIVQDGFNVYFPILLILLTLATYFSLGSRFLSILGFQQFLEQEEQTGEFVEEGKELIKREKRRRERLNQSQRNRTEPSTGSNMSEMSSSNTRHRLGVAGNVQYSDNRINIPEESTNENIWDDNRSKSEYRRSEPPRNIFDDI